MLIKLLQHKPFKLILGLTIGFTISWTPTTVVRGLNDIHPPIPTYDPVTSLEEVSKVEISNALQNEWLGYFRVPSASLLSNTNQRTLKEYFTLYYIPKSEIKKRITVYRYDPKKIYAWTKTVADKVNSETINPELVIENGRAIKFKPPIFGKKLDRHASTLEIIRSLEANNNLVDLIVKTTKPNLSLAGLNTLGISELVGRGESKFTGSPANRRHNIIIGLEKMRGIIIAPGAEFSFNEHLGPVEADQGFKPELVIKASGTVPELGGGLCQVSSTVFRAVMHSGLPITQRKNHSYAVQYYAPQGTDATIYPGIIDFKFRNDTKNSVLIWPYLKNNDYLVFDFYGTRDNRSITLSTPIVYDKKTDGSMKATWTRTVENKGVIKTDKFSSNYLPPALFQKREEFVSNPDSPIPSITNPPTTTTEQ